MADFEAERILDVPVLAGTAGRSIGVWLDAGMQPDSARCLHFNVHRRVHKQNSNSRLEILRTAGNSVAHSEKPIRP